MMLQNSKNLINRLEKYVDDLEKLTESLERLEQRLREGIDSISDVQSLSLLRNAASSHGSSSQRDVSDTASRRLTMVAETALETQSLGTGSISQNTGISFVTAQTGQPSQVGTRSNGELPIPGSWPRSVTSKFSRERTLASPSALFDIHPVTHASKPYGCCIECLEEHHECVLQGKGSSCSRCHDMHRSCTFNHELIEYENTTLEKEAEVPGNDPEIESLEEDMLRPARVPQNQRVLSELIQKAQPRKPLSFQAGDVHYGENLEAIKIADINYLTHSSANLLNLAHNGSSAAKRMFLELRNIRTGNVPFVSAAPVGDSLDKVLASIEGPPETPYEGGVFWITVRISNKDIHAPPLMRFHTKVYHPNISPQGHICADYKEKWSSVFSTGPCRTVLSPDALWYRGKSQVIH